MDDYLDTPMESDDVFPCKGCGDILEEGKAFELAGNRWHLDCFRCNTCGTLLDSDANLLLLGDGSLICNNCTYSCSACGDKIEDLAILTGDQAFCATCFRCRNCKRKIENLRYARTSQGIFCMSCHESLMARRRKKSKAAAQAKAREKEHSPMVEKSLPALPPNAIPPNAFSNDRVDPESDTPTELSPRPRPAYARNDSSRSLIKPPPRSPERITDANKEKESNLPLPSTTYRKNRNSALYATADTSNHNADDSSFFIPVALDPSPVPSATPRSTNEGQAENRRTKDKDYFSLAKTNATSERKADSQSSTPHIAFQEKSRQTSSSEYESSPAKDLGRKLSKSSRVGRSNSAAASPVVGDDKSQKAANGKSRASDDFKLQEAPKSKKLTNSRTNSQPTNSPEGVGSRSNSRKDKDAQGRPSEPTQHLQTGDVTSTPRSSQDSRSKDEEDMASSNSASNSYGTSSASHVKAIPRKEVPNTTSRTVNGRSGSASSKPHAADELGPALPPRPGMPAPKAGDSYMAPRPPPAPPTHAAGKESVSSAGDQSEAKISPRLPRWSAGGDLGMDEEMARILGTDENSYTVISKASTVARHGRTNSTESSSVAPRIGHARSVSETTRATTSPHWPKTPTVDEHVNGINLDISSPMSLHVHDDSAFLKRQLRSSEQRVAELERQFTNEKNLENLDEKLEAKRKTVSVLDTQTEIMIRQLEVLAGYVERAKESKQPIDARELEDSAIRDFVQKLDKLKLSMTAALEQLHTERDEVLEEKNKAIADRDSARVEFEQLVSKNAQLADLNNDLTHQIQERFKSHSDRSPMNGLGIYQQHKGTSNHSVSLDNSSINTGTTMVVPEHEEPILEAGPTVINIRKGQVKKFNWKKGSKAMAQKIGQGVNRTVVAFQQPERERHPGMEGGNVNIGLPYNMTMTPVDASAQQPLNNANRHAADNARQGFFGFKKSSTMPNKMAPSSLTTATAAEAPTVLFGSELAERADYEGRQIPCVVTRCIEEVELRGMDMEGIYRKTGGNGQTKAIQEGFDKNENFDISDPDIDITSVTSVLKQYFRKLPNPLLTYEVYDRILETNNLQDDEEKCNHLQNAFNQLPQQHRDCLEFLMFHLSRVAGRERENLMTPKNLAVVFAPTIMRDLTIEREMTDMHAKNLVVQFIIENSHKIFN